MLPAIGSTIPAGKYVKGFISNVWYRTVTDCLVDESPESDNARRLVSGSVKNITGFNQNDEVIELGPGSLIIREVSTSASL